MRSNQARPQSIVGRRLTVVFSPKMYVSIEKQLVAPKLFVGDYKAHERQAYLEDINEVLGERFYTYLGVPMGNSYGSDMNSLISTDEFWGTAEEFERLDEAAREPRGEFN